MTIEITFSSSHPALVTLVHDFAKGLGYDVETDRSRDAIQFAIPDGAEMLLHVLTHAALGAIRLGLDPHEPMCEVRYHEPNAAAEVAMTLRLSDISLKGASTSI